MSKINIYKPAVSNKILIFFAGLVWLLVGIMLMTIAFNWLSTTYDKNKLLLIIVGLISALIIHRSGFSKIANTNLNRILLKHEKSCLLSFYPWKSYLLIIIMIFMGTMLRHSSIPKQFLAVLYISIGLALALSSTTYLRVLFKKPEVENG